MSKHRPTTIKSFRVGIPALVYVTIAARDKRSAVAQAKRLEAMELQSPVAPYIGGQRVEGVSLGKFVLGTDPIEEIS